MFLRVADKLTEPGDRNNTEAVLQVSIAANREVYEEIRRESVMCDALRDLMKDVIETEVEKGVAEGIAKELEKREKQVAKEVAQERQKNQKTFLEAIRNPKFLIVFWNIKGYNIQEQTQTGDNDYE